MVCPDTPGACASSRPTATPKRGRSLLRKRALLRPIGGPLLQSLDDTDVAHGAVAERRQRLLVGRTVVGGDRVLHARKLGDDDALPEAGLARRRWGAACQIAAAERRDRGWRQLGIGRQSRL